MFQSAIQHPPATGEVRVGEILSAFSYALDITEGQPAGHSIRAAWIGTFVGLAAGLRDEELSDCTYAVLLKDLGCSSNAARVAELFLGDDRKLKHQFKLIGPEAADFLHFIETTVGAGEPEETRQCAIETLSEDAGPILTGFIDTRCNQGARIARALRFSDRVAEGIACLDEHWDGSGMPIGLLGEDIPLLSRIALLAQVADVFFMTGGAALAMAEVAARRGSWLDPALVDLFLDLGRDPGFWEALAAPDIEAQLLSLDAAQVTRPVDEPYLDAIAAAFGEVIDAKSPYTAGHSARVGHYTDAIASELGFTEGPRRRLRRAAMLHDIGKLGISNRILDKQGPLTSEEWEEMRVHAQLTGEILGRISVMRDMAMIAAAHHEKLDGTGYPLRLDHALIGIETRIITCADIYDALTAERPYRTAMPVDRALTVMEEECGTSVDPVCLQALKAVVRRGI
jgi:putative nucleotidyltransferase with HDIG domain